MASSARVTLARGAIWGAAGGALAASVECGVAVALAAGYFDGLGEIVRLGLAALAVGAGLGALVGALAALAWTGLGRHRPSAAATAALLAAPLCVYCGWSAFAGPRVSQLPGRDLWRVLTIGFGVAVAYFSARRLARTEAQAGWRWWHASGALLLAIGACVADQRVLVRLYPWFHLGLQLTAAMAVALATWVLAQRRARVPLPLALLALAAVLASPWAALALARTRGLRSFAVAHTPGLGAVVRLASPATRAPLAATTAHAATPAAPAGSAPRLGDVDVVVVTIDALRADELRAEVAPTLARLADGGARFLRAYTAVPHTSFAVASLMTGKYLYTQATARALGAGTQTPPHQTLAAILRREGYKTAAFYPPSAFFVDRERLREFEASGYDFEYQKLEFLGARERTEQVFQFFADEKPARAFLWVHYLEPHEPYEAHPGLSAAGDAPRARYRGEVRFVDAEVARLVDWLAARPRRTLLVVAADHGEEFDEHGGRYHGTTLYEEQIHVPLFFTLLGGAARGDAGLAARPLAAPVSLVDVAPTLLELLSVPRSLRMQGVSLASALGPVAVEPLAHAVFAEIAQEKAIVRGDDKLICDFADQSCKRFALASDAGERRAREDEPAREQALRAELAAWVESQLRYEQAPGSALERAFGRATTGDRQALSELAQALHGEVASGIIAARMLLRFPPQPALRPEWERALREHDDARAAWARVGLALLGDGGALAAARAHLPAMCGRDGDDELCGRAALATRDVVGMGRALERSSDPAGAFGPTPGTPVDHELALELVRALGHSGDARAKEPLRLALAPVRLRAAALQALAELGAPDIVDTLARWAPAEPYADVRRQMAEVLATLAPRATTAQRGAALASLIRLCDDSDAAVREAALQARARLQPEARTDSASQRK